VKRRAFYQQEVKIGQNVSMRKMLTLKVVALIVIGVCLFAIIFSTLPAPDWHKGEMYVAIPPSDLDVDTEFEKELASLFAQRMHLKVKLVTMENDQIAQALMSHKVHIAAAGMRAVAPARLRFSTPYQTLSELVICKDNPPKNIDELLRRSIAVMSESAHDYALRAIAEHQPDLRWALRRHQSDSSLLKEVAEGKLDCTVANEEQIASARNFYQNLADGYDLKTQSHLAWAVANDADSSLLNAANEFFEAIKNDGNLNLIIDRYYGHNERLETVDAVAFVSNSRTVLPQYKHWFEEASALTGIEWQLLAALAYQESHWDPHATSYTHVRGMMMLTDDTADRMNLDDRLDARNSIIAGAKYLQLLKEGLPGHIDEKERIWMALAAYNQGMGHLEDARILAEKSNLNPDVWSDVRKVMPLLSRPAYFEQAKHGRARGGEAVILVETVRLYFDMLNRLENENVLNSSDSYLGMQPLAPDNFNSP
jgi:membrane-bound lytic murein transglycosylase F